MGHMVPRERDLAIDLESGGTTSEEEGNRDPVSGVRQAKKFLGRVWSGIIRVDGSIEDESVPDSSEKAALMIDKNSRREDNVGVLSKKTIKEKRKKTSVKKAPKPPRPPGGPSLDAADQKLVREISELAMLKRARVERMKAQKKMKAAKAAASSSSSSSSLCAMIITLLFCLVIIFQGMFSRDSSQVSFAGSPESARGALISVQYYKNPSANATDSLGSESPNLVEQISGSRPDT